MRLHSKDWTELRLTVSYSVFKFGDVCFDLLLLFLALWFRLSERIKIPLPMNQNLQNDIWTLIKSFSCFDFFEIAENRETPKLLDRKEYFCCSDIADEEIKEKIKSSYFIYSYHPVDDPTIRGSCQEFKTRTKINFAALQSMSVEQIIEKYEK